MGKAAEPPGVSGPGAPHVPAVGHSSHPCGQRALLINVNPEAGLVTRMTAVLFRAACRRNRVLATMETSLELLLELSLKLSVLCSKRLQNLVV